MSETPHPHAVFWIDLDKISPNPYQPRKYFDPERLQDLSDSIRRYGVLQPIVVTRMEEFTPDGGMVAKYEIIAGERRFRASKLAGLEKIPAIVREGEQTDQEKLELAILENLQREDLNPVDKARSFNQLVEEFNHTHAQVAEALGKSREYVSNSLRLLQLPDYILDALSEGKITEGHTRPLLMLKERPDEQQTLFTQMISVQGMTVRAAEKFARSIATEKQRKDKDLDPEMKEIEAKLASRLGAKVSIDKKSQGGKLTIEFGSKDDLRALFQKIQEEAGKRSGFNSAIEMATAAQEIPDSIDKLFESQSEETDNILQDKTDTPIIKSVYPSQTPPAQQPVKNDFVPAHMSPPVRDFVQETTQETNREIPVGFDNPSQDATQKATQHVDLEVADLQKEIDALATSATPDQFDDQSRYSLRSMRDSAQNTFGSQEKVEHQMPQEKSASSFAFHEDVIDNTVVQSQTLGSQGYIPQAQVDLVSTGAMDSFANARGEDPIANVDSVSMGGEFVPVSRDFETQHTQEQAIEKTIHSQALHSDTSGFVPEKKFSDNEIDEDLYRLDNFSV